MTYQVFENVLSKDAIQTLLDFYHQEDDYTDDRKDVRSKALVWNQDCFPQGIIQTALDRILFDPYDVEAVYFFDSKISFRLHTDSGNCDNDLVYRNVILPLLIDESATTVLFDNHYAGPSTRFARSNIDPFRYNLLNRNNQFVWVDDIRHLLHQCKTCPDTITEFDVSDRFIQDLEYIISTRYTLADRRTSDYSRITNLQESIAIDDSLYTQYLHHMPREDVNGLTVEYVYHWRVGGALTFPRSQLHCAGAGHKRKIGISIFTRYKS